jgi:hypothetical protein
VGHNPNIARIFEFECAAHGRLCGSFLPCPICNCFRHVLALFPFKISFKILLRRLPAPFYQR